MSSLILKVHKVEKVVPRERLKTLCGKEGWLEGRYEWMSGISECSDVAGDRFEVTSRRDFVDCKKCQRIEDSKFGSSLPRPNSNTTGEAG
jgi:hypothetical protein